MTHCPFRSNITAEQAARVFSGRELAQFHNYNDNGIRAEWRSLGDRLIAVRGGAFLAYGDTGYYASELDRLSHHLRQRVSKGTIDTLVCCIRRTIERGEEFLARESEVAE